MSNNKKTITTGIRRYFRLKSQDVCASNPKKVSVGWAKVSHKVGKVQPMSSRMTYDEVSVAFGNRKRPSIVYASREELNKFPITYLAPKL